MMHAGQECGSDSLWLKAAGSGGIVSLLFEKWVEDSAKESIGEGQQVQGDK